MGLKLSEGIIWTTQDQFISKNQKILTLIFIEKSKNS